MADDTARTISYTELPPPARDSQLAVEWNAYRREVGRLIAEGHEGRFVLFKGEEILGIWNTREEATTEGVTRFGLQPFLIHQIRSREPLVRGPKLVKRFAGEFFLVGQPVR